MERASSEGVFEALEAIYSVVPPTTCRRQTLCCRESPRIYFVEFLNLCRTLMERPHREQVIIQERSIRYAFLDICDPALSCPLLEGNRCLLYGARSLRCRLWGHESRESYNRHITSAKRNMARFSRLMECYGLSIPAGILDYHPPYCQVMVVDSKPLTDEDALLLEERLRLLEERFLSSPDSEDRCVDFARHLYATLFGIGGYGSLRVRVMREYLEYSSERALKQIIERSRTLTLLPTQMHQKLS